MVRQVILKIEGTSFTLRVFTQQCARKGGKKSDGGNPHNDAFKPIFYRKLPSIYFVWKTLY